MSYSIKDLARFLGVSMSTVYGWIARRELPHYRLGAAGRRGRIIVQQADLDLFLAQRRLESEQPQETEQRPVPREPLKHLHLRPK
ncbi:MAG: helix-turn-helix domain-containing protein [Zavarzinella sp.]